MYGELHCTQFRPIDFVDQKAIADVMHENTHMEHPRVQNGSHGQDITHTSDIQIILSDAEFTYLDEPT